MEISRLYLLPLPDSSIRGCTYERDLLHASFEEPFFGTRAPRPRNVVTVLCPENAISVAGDIGLLRMSWRNRTHRVDRTPRA